MPRLAPRASPIGLALTAFEVWRRIPPKHRRRILKQARKHGPRLAAKAVRHAAARRRRNLT